MAPHYVVKSVVVMNEWMGANEYLSPPNSSPPPPSTELQLWQAGSLHPLAVCDAASA